MWSRCLLALPVLLGACADYTVDGLEVEITTRAVPGALKFRSDLGYDIELSRGYLVTSSVELVGCPRLSRWLAPIGTAQAHLPATPTRLGAPVVEPLGGDGAALGTMRPPPDRYCHLRVSLTPADADARGLPAELRFVGRTVYLAGAYRGPGDVADRALALISSEAVSAEVPVPDLVLDGESPRRRRLELSRDPTRWFDGIALDSTPAPAVARRLLDNIGASLAVNAL
jgi:hypothetical protein